MKTADSRLRSARCAFPRPVHDISDDGRRRHRGASLCLEVVHLADALRKSRMKSASTASRPDGTRRTLASSWSRKRNTTCRTESLPPAGEIAPFARLE